MDKAQRTTKIAAGLVTDVEVRALGARHITAETAQHFGYGVGTYKGEAVQVAPYYDADGKLVAQKLRFRDKRFKVTGDLKTALPFGAHAFPRTGKMLVLTEGEIDALSMSQVQGNKWPVVSIASGAGPQVKKYVAERLEYFNGFEKIVLMFDQDEAGREGAKAAALVLGNRAFIAELPLKDVNEMLVAGKTAELVEAMWRAKQHRPDGIVELSTLKDALLKGVETGLPWPWPTLTEATYGRHLGEVYAIGAGTGVGKTEMFTEVVSQTVSELGLPVCCFFLEQSPGETALRIAGKFINKPLHIPDAGWDQSDLDEAWKLIEQSRKVFLYDSFGVADWASIEERIRFLAHAEGVQHFFLDHLTALTAGEDDERRSLDTIMSSIGGIVKELNICIYFISHLATPEGKPHEEGGRVMIRHYRGSRSIGYWSHFIFALERNQQEADEDARSITTFRVLKDRKTGRSTGMTFHLKMERDTGRLIEMTPDAPFPVASDSEGHNDF